MVNNKHERLKPRHLPNDLAWTRLRGFKEGAKPEHFVVSGIGKERINT